VAHQYDSPTQPATSRRTYQPGDKFLGLHIRSLIELAADRLGIRDAVRDLSDLDAVRSIQQREGCTPCYGRDWALRPGPDGICLETQCLWRNFCSAYRSKAVPLDGYLSPMPSQSQVAEFARFLRSRAPQAAQTRMPGLGVTVRSDAELEALSRKLVIGAPRSTICESSESVNTLRPVQISFEARESSRGGHYTHYFQIERAVLWTANPARLYNWYASARSLVDASALDYLPHLSVESEEIGVWKTNNVEFTQLAAPAFQKLETLHQGTPDREVWVNDSNVVPLLNLEIPFLESATLEDISKVMQDYPEELCAFREFLYKNIDKIKDKRVDSETFGADLAAVRREIDEQIRKLRSDLKKSQLKNYVEIAGGTAAAFTLAIYCVMQSDSHTWQILGPSGFLYTLASKAADYLNSRLTLKESPTYFLWQIGEAHRL